MPPNNPWQPNAQTPSEHDGQNTPFGSGAPESGQPAPSAPWSPSTPAGNSVAGHFDPAGRPVVAQPGVVNSTTGVGPLPPIGAPAQPGAAAQPTPPPGYAYPSPQPPAYAQPAAWTTTPGYAAGNIPAEGTPGAPAALPTAQRSRLKLLLIATGALVLLGGIGVFAAAYLARPKAPDQLFRDALTNALATPQQQVTLKAAGVSATLQYNLTATTDPRISTKVSVTTLGKLSYQTYAGKQNTYVRYTNTGITGLNTTYANILNKWVQLTKNGTTPDGVEPGPAGLPNLANELAGVSWPLGNFAAKDRQTLVDDALQSQVYTYDAAKVTRAVLDGQTVYVYPVTLHTAKLHALLKKQLALWSFLKSDQINDAVTSAASLTNVKLYISTGSGRLLKLTATGPGTTESAAFAYGGLTFPTEPKPAISLDQFEQFASAEDASTGIDTTTDSGAAD